MWLTNLGIITPDREIAYGSMRIVGGLIDAIVEGGCPPYAGEPALDCDGLIALPGLIDLYGDLLERELEPRPGSLFPMDAALHEFDKRVAGAGMTLAYAALTLDTPAAHWRSRRPEQVLAAASLVAQMHEHQLTELRTHIRVQAEADGALQAALDLLDAKRCGLIGLRGIAEESTIIAEAAKARDVQLVLHDAASATEIAQAHALGVKLCFAPRTLALAYAAKSCGMLVAASGPEIVRGRTHPAGAAMRLAVKEGLVDLLISDESPIALLQACFTLSHELELPLHQMIALATSSPARLLGLQGHGRLEANAQADIILIQPGTRPRVRATVRAGEFVYRRGALTSQRGAYVSD